jgi:hypothetical protein
MQLVGLSNLSLNQFTQYITKADALIEEITHICKDMPKIDLPRVGEGRERVKLRTSRQSPVKTRLHTPSLT